MTDEIKMQYMYLVEGEDSNGDPIRALVRARDTSHARKKVREDYEGTIKSLRTERITGHQWEGYLEGYGSQYGPFNPYEGRGDYASEAGRYAMMEGRPVFLR